VFGDVGANGRGEEGFSSVFRCFEGASSTKSDDG
jgi:hypothetical protein